MMKSIVVRYIIKAMDIELASPETVNGHRRLVILTGAYLVINFGCYL